MIPYNPLSGKEEALARLNPEKIYLENVRSLLGVNAGQARKICETAVRQGVFERYVEVLCPDGAVAISAEDESQLPKTVRCWTEEQGEIEQVELPTDNLQKVTFYKMKHESPTELHPRSA
jgi:hypothetical protein